MTIPISITRPSLIHAHAACDNGLYPDAAFYGAVVNAHNHARGYCRKPLFRRVCKLGQAGGASGVAWRWHCKTGYGARRVCVVVVLGQDDRAIAVNPYVTVTITKSGGSPQVLTYHGGLSHDPSVDAPEQWVPIMQWVDVDEAAVYAGEVEFFDNARIIALMVYEEHLAHTDTTLGHIEWQPGASSPILDSHIGDLVSGFDEMARGNRGLRADWSPVDGVARTRTSATLINLIDNATTGSPTAATPGWTFNTTNHNTYSATTAPFVLAVYGSIAAGSGTVRIVDTGGTSLATVTINNATPQWFTATGNLTIGAAVKLDPQFNGDGVNAISVLALSMYEAH